MPAVRWIEPVTNKKARELGSIVNVNGKPHKIVDRAGDIVRRENHYILEPI